MSSLTALLNSLHSHLQTQTHLLPPLHVQLGLPVSALEDELATIQQNLMDSVEAQIESRRKQVEMWMEKCEAVEQSCILYSKVLGGHIKNTGRSVGELRKEKVLPHRFNLASDHQEKLRQLYHTKLEQLTTLSNRLHAMIRVLGNDFFTPDLLDDDLDTSVLRDVTPERFLRMEKELVRGKAEVSKRLQELRTAFVQIDWLYTELGKTPPSLDDLPSSIFSPPSFSSSSMSGSRMDPFVTSTPTPTSRNQSLIIHCEQVDYRRIFANFVAKVEEAEDERNLLVGLEHVDPTPGLLKWAADVQASLEDDKRKRETHIQAMYDELEGLWTRLGVQEVHMDEFVDAHPGLTDEAVQEYELELERMLELKRDRMSVFVENARQEIVELWDELMVSEEERQDFAPFADDTHTEELLKIHEDEIKKLKEEKRMKAPLLAAIKKYFEISEEEEALAAAASDQSRLTGRGARDPGRLLREERMRKRVTKVKPRLEQELLASLPVWEQEANRPFLVYGESMLQGLIATLSAADQENKQKPPRAGSVPPRSTTPVTHSYAPDQDNKRKPPRATSVPPRSTTPVTRSYAPTNSGVVVPAVRPAGSSVHSGPNKRLKLNQSTDRAPLGFSRSHNERAVSPSKIPGSRSKQNATSSLPRPIAMPVPKPGTQHHALGHGRMPSSGVLHGSVNGYGASGIRSASAMGYMAERVMAGRVVSGSALVAKKASRARRESFKPRSSMEADANLGVSTRWAGLAASVQEEDEY
ncbi:hypothetical protein BDZ89DRAFT_1009085 [Hymenopellis radicata]|nr:hypothetical protein BDZ89DRAFT_1009085 [Hymenopellis radicata]